MAQTSQGTFNIECSCWKEKITMSKLTALPSTQIKVVLQKICINMQSKKSCHIPYIHGYPGSQEKDDSRIQWLVDIQPVT